LAFSLHSTELVGASALLRAWPRLVRFDDPFTLTARIMIILHRVVLFIGGHPRAVTAFGVVGWAAIVWMILFKPG
jgi:hypothetical protein